MIPKVYKYAISGVLVVGLFAGTWFHGVGHGKEVERIAMQDAIEEQLSRDKKEIEKLRRQLKERRKVITNTVTEIRHVKDTSPCKCLDYVAPVELSDSLLKAYNASIRPETYGTLSVCRVPLACDFADVFGNARQTVGIDGGV